MVPAWPILLLVNAWFTFVGPLILGPYVLVDQFELKGVRNQVRKGPTNRSVKWGYTGNHVRAAGVRNMYVIEQPNEMLVGGAVQSRGPGEGQAPLIVRRSW